MIYFGYGSNMSPRIMAATCGDWRALGAAKLMDYRLAFTRKSARWGHGVADVVPAAGEIVWGVLYEIGDDCLAALDVKEGVGIAYNRHQITVTRKNSTAITAMTYMVINKLETELNPSPAYLDAIIDGAQAHELPEDYVNWLKSIAIAE